MNPPQEFSKVKLTLDNVIIPNERLRNTPSCKDGCPHSLEVDLRIVSCEYIQTAGILLRLPQVAMATAQVLFHRFFYSKSFIKYNMIHVAMACIFLAAKIEENCRRVRDVANVFHHMKQKRMGRPVVPMEYMGEEYFKLKASIIKYERFVLKELGFCVHIRHPHKLIISYLQILSLEQNVQLAQKSWNFMNDSLRTNVFVRFSPETIACACIFMSARQLKIGLPQRPPWWTIFDVCFEDIEAISLDVLALYRRPRVFLLDLEKKLNILKEEFSKKQIEIREINLKKPTSSAVKSSDEPVGTSLSPADERKASGSKSSPNATCPIQSRLQPSPLLQSISTSPRNANHGTPPNMITNGKKTKTSPKASKHSLPPSPSSPAYKKRKRSSSPDLKSPGISVKNKIISPIRVAPTGGPGDSGAESSPKENGIPLQYRRDYSKHNNQSSRSHRHTHHHHHSTSHRETSTKHHHKGKEGKEGRSSSRHTGTHQSKGRRTEHLERHR